MTQVETRRVISGLADSAPCPSSRQGLPVLHLERPIYERSLDCVHCGLCLPACPTYTENGLEGDSPRGRIYLMKGLADGKIDLTDGVQKHLDRCLDCRACETACPSGVVYHELIEATRAQLGQSKKPTTVERLVNTMFYRVFPYPRRLKLAMLPPRILQKLGLWRILLRSPLRKLMPAQIEKMQQMLPVTGPLWEKTLGERHPVHGANGKPQATVALFSGCIGSVLFQDVNRRSIALLQHAGCDVIVPANQTCCGAIDHHGGRVESARKFAHLNIDAFLGTGLTPDYIVTNIAGCGAMLKDYAHLLPDDSRAQSFYERVRDISEVLTELNPARPKHALKRKVTYHDACHLAHAQRVTEPPRNLLSWIKGLEVVTLPESDMCCGAAGTYNLSQPQMARQLAERKIRHIQETGAGTCVTGNV